MAALFEHYIVLMLENRSFDHLFGYLGLGEGLPPGGITNYLTPGVKSGQAYTSREGGDYVSAGQGPLHTLEATNVQLFGVEDPSPVLQAQPPAMDGFVASFQTALELVLKRPPIASELQQVMNVFDPVQLPVLATLARNFVLCDHWHADVPGPTMPNRAYVHAATSQGYTYNADWKPEFTCQTIYDRINGSAEHSWRVYYHDHNDILKMYPRIGKNPTNNVRFDTNFVADIAGDKLATYSFVTPAFLNKPQYPANSMHAPADVRPADKLVADIYCALQANPEVWKKTLLIVVWDEHGGYADHVSPPATVSPDGIPARLDEPGLVPFDFNRLGLRVPCILVSPWFEPCVDSTLYSHASIPGSLIEILDLPGGFLTKRDAQAAKLTEKYLTNDGTRTWRTDVPDVIPPVQPQALDDIQRELLDASVYLDPHPANRTTLRTQDIHDPGQASDFIQTQIAKHLEHYFASGGGTGADLSADNQPPSPVFSPARVAELKRSKPS